VLLLEHGKRPELLACMGETQEGLLHCDTKGDKDEV
jgi:hypothetical protein